MRNQDLILGCVRELSLSHIRPFVRSLRGTNYRGHCLFFSNNIDSQTSHFLQDNHIQTADFFYCNIKNHNPFLMGWFFWKRLLRLVKRRDFQLQLARLFWHFFYLRFLFARNYILKNPQFSRIMLTDVRDVYFQLDPFSWLPPSEGVYCFAEHSGRLIGNCPNNSQMIREVFGEEGLQRIQQFQIYCAGTIFGTRSALLQYLERFLDLALAGIHLWPFRGGDQGIHNWIVHFEQLPSLKLLDNEGPVFTMGCVPKEQILQNSKGQVFNRKGDIFPVLHQYDRFKDLARSLPFYELPE